MTDYTKYSQKQLDDAFLNACMVENISTVKFLLTSHQLKKHARLNGHTNPPLVRACYTKNLTLVKYLLTSPQLKDFGHSFPNLHENSEAALVTACGVGALDIVEYLLTSPELVKAGHTHPDFHAQADQPLLLACENGHLNIVEYLLKYYTCLEDTAASLYEQTLVNACQNNHLPIIQYLLEDLGDNYPCNLQVKGFKAACECGHEQVISYLIFDYGIEKTSELNDYLHGPNKSRLDNELVLNMFAQQEFKQKLQSTLPMKLGGKNKIKI